MADPKPIGTEQLKRMMDAADFIVDVSEDPDDEELCIMTVMGQGARMEVHGISPQEAFAFVRILAADQDAKLDVVYK